MLDPISIAFYIMPALDECIIIGLPDILGNVYDYFTMILEDARKWRPKVRIERPLIPAVWFVQRPAVPYARHRKLPKSYQVIY